MRDVFSEEVKKSNYKNAEISYENNNLVFKTIYKNKLVDKLKIYISQLGDNVKEKIYQQPISDLESSVRKFLNNQLETTCGSIVSPDTIEISLSALGQSGDFFILRKDENGKSFAEISFLKENSKEKIEVPCDTHPFWTFLKNGRLQEDQ